MDFLCNNWKMPKVQVHKLGLYRSIKRAVYYNPALFWDMSCGKYVNSAKKTHLRFNPSCLLRNVQNLWGGPGSSVGIATELRAGRSGIESRWGRDFPTIQTSPGAHPAPCKMGIGSFPGVKCGRGVLLTTHLLLVPLGHTGPVTVSHYLYLYSICEVYCDVSFCC